VNNNPLLGRVFTNIDTANSISDFRRLDDDLPKKQDQRIFKSTFTDEKYFQGNNIQIMYTENGMLDLKNLLIPAPGIGTQCSFQPAKYLKKFNHKCIPKISKELCQTGSVFDPYIYLLDYTETNLNLPLLIANLKTQQSIEANVSVVFKKDLFHNLKFKFAGKTVENINDILSHWYGSLVHPADVWDQSSVRLEQSWCSNVVTDVKYTFGWSESTIVSININIVVGNIPLEIPNRVLSKIRVNEDDEVKFTMNVVQKFSTEFVYFESAEEEQLEEFYSTTVTNLDEYDTTRPENITNLAPTLSSLDNSTEKDFNITNMNISELTNNYESNILGDNVLNNNQFRSRGYVFRESVIINVLW